MRNVAGYALTISAAFMALVAMMLDSPALFYMSTALIATMGASRLQAWLAVKGLRFARVAPESVRVGDLVTVEITVWSERRIRRPLITVVDHLPANLPVADRTSSLPIAPAYDRPIETQYQFRPLRRGRYRWTGLLVEGTDALGLVTRMKEYATAPAEMTVLPRPFPVSIDLPNAAGWGISEAESGQTRGAGLEPRGVRAYVNGDSLRHVHWRSTAKTGQLLVKEFEAGTHASAAFLFQLTEGSNIGGAVHSTLEAMCGHVVFLAEMFLRQGARVEFPTLENARSFSSQSERTNEIYELLAGVEANQQTAVSDGVWAASADLPPGSILFVLVSVQDPALPSTIAHVDSRGLQVVPLIYDPRSLDPKGRFASAADPDYVQALRAAGTTPILMPTEAPRDPNW
jgi:uncharacterized protein (DUF58 family)